MDGWMGGVCVCGQWAQLEAERKKCCLTKFKKKKNAQKNCLCLFFCRLSERDFFAWWQIISLQSQWSVMVTLKSASHEANQDYCRVIDTIIDITYQKCEDGPILGLSFLFLLAVIGNIPLFKHSIRCHPGWFSPQCQHTTAPPSFATSAWSHPLQHKHIQETRPAARIISPCNTTRLLSSGSPLRPSPRSVPSLKLLSNGPADRWLDTHCCSTTDQTRTLESLGFLSLAEIVAQRRWSILPRVIERRPAGYSQRLLSLRSRTRDLFLASRKVTTAPSVSLSICLYL